MSSQYDIPFLESDGGAEPAARQHRKVCGKVCTTVHLCLALCAVSVAFGFGLGRLSVGNIEPVYKRVMSLVQPSDRECYTFTGRHCVMSCDDGQRCGWDHKCHCTGSCAGISQSDDGYGVCLDQKNVEVASGFTLRNVGTGQYLSYSDADSSGYKYLTETPDKSSSSAKWSLWKIPSQDPVLERYYLSPKDDKEAAVGKTYGSWGDSLFLKDLGQLAHLGSSTVGMCHVYAAGEQYAMQINMGSKDGGSMYWDGSKIRLEHVEDPGANGYWVPEPTLPFALKSDCWDPFGGLWNGTKFVAAVTSSAAVFRDLFYCLNNMPNQYTVSGITGLIGQMAMQPSKAISLLQSTYLSPITKDFNTYVNGVAKKVKMPKIDPMADPQWVEKVMDYTKAQISGVTSLDSMAPLKCVMDDVVDVGFEAAKPDIIAALQDAACQVQEHWTDLTKYTGAPAWLDLDHAFPKTLNPVCTKKSATMLAVDGPLSKPRQLSASADAQGFILKTIFDHLNLQAMAGPIINGKLAEWELTAEEQLHKEALVVCSREDIKKGKKLFANRTTVEAFDFAFGKLLVPYMEKKITDPAISAAMHLLDSLFDTLTHSADAIVGLVPYIGSSASSNFMTHLNDIHNYLQKNFAGQATFALSFIYQKIQGKIEGVIDETIGGLSEEDVLNGLTDKISAALDSKVLTPDLPDGLGKVVTVAKRIVLRLTDKVADEIKNCGA